MCPCSFLVRVVVSSRYCLAVISAATIALGAIILYKGYQLTKSN